MRILPTPLMFPKAEEFQQLGAQKFGEIVRSVSHKCSALWR
jgi:hypothetical protein